MSKVTAVSVIALILAFAFLGSSCERSNVREFNWDLPETSTEAELARETIAKKAELVASLNDWVSTYNAEDITYFNVEYIAAQFRDAVGFDYNHEDAARRYMLSQDDASQVIATCVELRTSLLQETGGQAASDLVDILNSAYSDGLPFLKIENVVTESEHYPQVDSSRIAYTKIQAVYGYICSTLSQQADRLRAQELREARLRPLRRRFRENYREGVHTTFYNHVNNPRYVNSRSWNIKPSIGLRDNGQSWMCLTLGFHRSDWIFIDDNGITVVIDGRDHQVNFSMYRDGDTDVGGGISEWVTLCDRESLIRSIASATRVIVVFRGKEGNRRIEHTLTSSEMTAFRETVEFYDLL